MGKPKNKSKGKDADYDSEPEAVDQMEETESKPAPKASKKAKKKNKKDDDWEDDIAAELASLSVEANKGNKDAGEEEEDVPAPTKKEKKKKKKQKQDSDDEEESTDAPVVNRGNKKAAFNMLMMEDEEEEEKQQSDSEEEVKEVEKPVKQQKKKEKKKKGKEKTAEEDDLDALLAEIDKPAEKQSKKSKKEKKKEAAEAEENGTDEKEPTPEVEKVEPKVVSIDDLDDEDDDDKKKKKKKGKEKKDGEEEGEKDGEGAEDDGGTVKSAAQKKKEKKERERLKKLADKKKQSQKESSKPADDKPEATTSTGESVEKPSTEATEKEEKAGSGNEGEGEADGKKKKKKKKGEKEEPEKKKKKAPVAAIREMLQRQKEEEERLKREEEERIRLEEEAHEARLEKKRLDEEKKAKKKEKEKERKARLKAEGKPVTAQQKQERLRAQQLLESMQAQGIIQKKDDQEDKEETKKKRPIYIDKKKMKKKKQDEETQMGETPSPEETPAQTPIGEEAPALTPDTKKEEKAEIKDDWMDSSSEEEEEKESSPEQEEATKIEIKDKSEVDEEDEEEESEEEDDDEDDDDEDDDDDETDSSEEEDDLTPYERAEKRIRKFHDKCEAARDVETLRAPVVCVLGHVDTGKTKILDKLRRTNVQDGEAGGITQQIGATNVPKYAILEKTTMCKEFQKKELKLPGLLIIDTPGHESFSNLRSRGSSLCDIAILVIDIMHGLEPQTIESINLLKSRKTPFVVALNKIDRLYQWKPNPNSDVMNTIKKQGPMAKAEFEERTRKVITELAEQGLNAALFYENKNPKEYISLIPTSAHSGDGMGNLVALICDLTQTWLAKKVSYSEELHATVMEVKALPGLGTTIDVILVNGKLKEGDQIVIAGTEGPVVTQIRGLLMPQPMKEFRVKGQYQHHKEVLAAQGVKVIGKDLEKALAGLPLYVATNDDEVEYYKEELSAALKEVLNSIKCVERGVFVQASTLGSLEALLEFLRTSEIPYAGINIGPVHRKDIMRASVMLEHDTQWAVILAFDVKVEREAQEMADGLGVRIFTADIIYHLEDKFLKFRADLKKQKQEEFKNIAVFPCKLRVLPQYIFNSRDPIVMGVMVEAGVVRMGTPICVPSKEFVFLGHITSIEVNHKVQDFARKGQEVCIKIENIPSETPKLYGRHFDHTDMLVSRVSRASIDAVKNHFRDDMTKPDWVVMLELKNMFQIL